MDPATFLADVPLFEGLASTELASIARHAVSREVVRNAVLLREGERPSSLYIVQTGMVRVLVSDEQGRELVLSELGPRAIFGELALIDGEPRSATVVAMEPTLLTVLSRNAFTVCLGEQPEIAIQLLRHLSRRMRELTGNLKEFALLDVQGRLCRLLLRLAKDRDGARVVGPVTQQELANRVGASREMVSRVLTGWRNESLISMRGKYITVGDGLADLIRLGDRQPLSR
ncbi:MAG: Crp/Fnr family transcriptional regulator [Gammaproteobacteria bacterium]|jgi:CRP/FNR family cyclic AMP-dependent transcriptional regulator|nr:Crp/Fnr family transcriptional regulator [Gammaproteobacteria bacterium]